MATATATSSSSLTTPLLRPNPNTNPTPRSLQLLRSRRCARAVTAAVAGGPVPYGAAPRRGIWSIRDDLVVPRSPYFPVESAAGQERGPSPMVMERFQSVVSQLFQHRIIRCGGPVEDDMANIIVAQLLYLDAIDPTKDIIMYVNSPGGSVTAGMAIFDTMKHIRPDVSTVCIGLAASMGAFLLSAGTKGKRYSLPNSRIMIHQPLGGAQGQETDLEIQANEMLHHKAKGVFGLEPHIATPQLCTPHHPRQAFGFRLSIWPPQLYPVSFSCRISSSSLHRVWRLWRMFWPPPPHHSGHNCHTTVWPATAWRGELRPRTKHPLT